MKLLLYPMNFDHISGCKVGFLPIECAKYFSAGIKMFENVLVFMRTKTRIANPVGTQRVELLPCSNFTDS